MLEMAKRTLNTYDVARVIDDDLGVESFLKITKEDITAKGKIRPIGSRHFAARAQLVQNLTGLLGGHSGGDIDKGRANSIKLIAKVLRKLNQNFSIYIKSIEGGGPHRENPTREVSCGCLRDQSRYLRGVPGERQEESAASSDA